jgi:hypothetical protein
MFHRGAHDRSFAASGRFPLGGVGDYSRKRTNSGDTARLPVQATAGDRSRGRRDSDGTARLPVQATANDRSRKRRNNEHPREYRHNDRARDTDV